MLAECSNLPSPINHYIVEHMNEQLYSNAYGKQTLSFL